MIIIIILSIEHDNVTHQVEYVAKSFWTRLQTIEFSGLEGHRKTFSIIVYVTWMCKL